MAFAGWDGSKFVRSRLQASLYWNEKRRLRRIVAASVATYLASIGLPEMNWGANFNDGLYWLPSDQTDPTSAPRWASEDEFFAKFTRPSVATYTDSDGVLRQAAANEPRFTYINGKRQLSLNDARTNKCTNYNANPTDLSAITTAGEATGVLSLVSDTAALATDGLDQICTSAKVYKLDNSSPSATQSFRVIVDGPTGNLNPHTVSAYVRGSGNARVYLQAGSQNYSALTSHYVRRANTFTADQTSRKIVIEADVGAIVYFILNQLEEASFASPVIVTTGAAATRAIDDFELPSAAEGVLQQAAASVVVRATGIYGAYGRILGGAGGTRIIGLNGSSNAIAMGSSVASTLANISTPLPDFGVAVGWDASGKSGSYNGNAITVSPSAMDADFTKSFLGRDENGVTAIGYYDLIVGPPTKLTDARLQALAVAA